MYHGSKKFQPRVFPIIKNVKIWNKIVNLKQNLVKRIRIIKFCICIVDIDNIISNTINKFSLTNGTIILIAFLNFTTVW